MMPTLQPTPTSSVPQATDPEGFPTRALGLPVLDVSTLNDLIQAGELDGRVAAVRGYWIPSLLPSCPAPSRWYSPLESYCNLERLSDVAYAGAECHKVNNGTECGSIHPPSGATTIQPRLIDNNGNVARLPLTDFRHFDPIPVVLVGHAGDARFLQCQADVRDACRQSFVVDTVAWSDGTTWPVALPDDAYAPRPLMTLDEVQSLVDGRLVEAAVLAGRDVSSIEPRLHAFGTDLSWVVRSLRGGDDDGKTQPADVTIVDDTTRQVVASIPLDRPLDYAPALLRAQASDANACCGDVVIEPFYRVSTADGAVLLEGLIGGQSRSGDDIGGTHWMPGAGALLDAGNYLLQGWRAQISEPGDVWGDAMDKCSTAISVGRDEYLRLEAVFPAQGPCIWQQPTFPESLY